MLGTANGATVAHVNIPIIRNMPVNIPKIEIQERIAEILSSYDDLIENNKKQIKLLEEAAECLYREWFVDLHFPGCEDVIEKRVKLIEDYLNSDHINPNFMKLMDKW